MLKEAAALGTVTLEQGQTCSFSVSSSLRQHLKDVGSKAITNAKRGEQP